MFVTVCMLVYYGTSNEVIKSIENDCLYWCIIFVTISVLWFYTETSSIKSLHSDTNALTEIAEIYQGFYIVQKRNIQQKKRFSKEIRNLLLFCSSPSSLIFRLFCPIYYWKGGFQCHDYTCNLLFIIWPWLSLSLYKLLLVGLKCLLWITITTNFHKITLILYSYDILLSKMTIV